MRKIEVNFKDIKISEPKKFELYRSSQMKAFKHLLFSLNMKSTEINKPMTNETYTDPYNPKTMLIMTLYSMEPPFY